MSKPWIQHAWSAVANALYIITQDFEQSAQTDLYTWHRFRHTFSIAGVGDRESQPQPPQTLLCDTVAADFFVGDNFVD
ncbi:MAG: hypothetical protein AAFQ89_08400 [Cyanobacteria bacterium J06626_18]